VLDGDPFTFGLLNMGYFRGFPDSCIMAGYKMTTAFFKIFRPILAANFTGYRTPGMKDTA